MIAPSLAASLHRLGSWGTRVGVAEEGLTYHIFICTLSTEPCVDNVLTLLLRLHSHSLSSCFYIKKITSHS